MTTIQDVGQITDMNLVSRTCVICGGCDSSLAYDQSMENITGIGDIGYHHLINVCNRCGFAFASPLLEESVILKYYEQMSNYEHPMSDGIRPAKDIRQINRQIQIITSRFPSGFKGTALDIGCSIAYGLSRLQEKGWFVLGLDPSEKCIDISKNKLNVEVEKGFFSYDLLSARGPFDVIILSHVLEHLVNPETVIKQLCDLLSDDGLVYIEVPNLMKHNGTKCYFNFEHVNFFTPLSLTNLIQQNGFDIDSLATFDNGKDCQPFYPVIALTIKKAKGKFEIHNDKSESCRVINDYKEEVDGLVKRINFRIENILNETSPGRLALWGAGIHTGQLLSETVLKNAKINCIFDNDPKKAGNMLHGVEIRSFLSAIDAKKDIDAILISSEASEDEIYKQLNYLENYGILIHQLYKNLPE